MTNADIIALLDEAGGDEYLVGIMYDNTVFDRFDKPDEPFKRDEMLKTIGGIDYVVHPGAFYNKKTGLRDIESFEYHPSDMIQAIILMKDPEDKKYLDGKQFVECC